MHVSARLVLRRDTAGLRRADGGGGRSRFEVRGREKYRGLWFEACSVLWVVEASGMRSCGLCGDCQWRTIVSVRSLDSTRIGAAAMVVNEGKFLFRLREQ